MSDIQKPKEIQQCAALISKHFDIEPNEFQTNGEFLTSNETLLTTLTRVISYMLEKDMTRLMNGLYRIDVDENDFKKALFESNPDKVSENIALLIIKRQLQKVKFRNQYSE